MIVYANVSLRHLAAVGRAFKWNRPSCQNHCHRKVWGHGWVRRYFDGHPEGISLQRFRCPECHTVFTSRPEGYWPRFQAAGRFIYDTLCRRLDQRLWPPGVTRQRAGHWLSKLLSKVAMDFPGQDPVSCLRHMYQRNIAFLV